MMFILLDVLVITFVSHKRRENVKCQKELRNNDCAGKLHNPITCLWIVK